MLKSTKAKQQCSHLNFNPANKLNSHWGTKTNLTSKYHLLRPEFSASQETAFQVSQVPQVQHPKMQNSPWDARGNNEQPRSTYRKTLSREGRTSHLLSCPLIKAKLNMAACKTSPLANIQRLK